MDDKRSQKIAVAFSAGQLKNDEITSDTQYLPCFKDFTKSLIHKIKSHL